ncbi:MAG: transglutaminase family protein [Pseudomonadota bacterium]
MKLDITHSTTYAYDEPVEYALQQVRLSPKSRENQQVEEWHIDISGGKKELEFEDQHNNKVLLISLLPDCQEVNIEAHGTVLTSDSAGIIGRHGGYAALWYFKRTTSLTKPGPQLRKLVKELGSDFPDDVAKLHALSASINTLVAYQLGHTNTKSTVEEILEKGKGVCQDHAHVFLSAVKLLGYPARYVSGYLMLNDRVEQDATHAWAEVYVDGLGWVGFDISNGICPDERYVPIATGLDYQETAPISGMRFGDSNESMIVTLQVQQ